MTAKTVTTAAERKRAFRLLFASLIVTGAGNSILFAILPPLARDLAIPEVYVGFIYTLASILFVLSSPLWGHASDRFGRRPMLVLSFSAYAASMACFAGAIWLGQHGVLTGGALIVTLVLSRAVYGAFGSAGTPSAQAYVADRTPPAMRTQALGGLSAAFGVGAAAGPGVAAWIAARFGLITPLILVGAIAVAAAIAIGLMLPERTPPRKTEGPRPGLLSSFSLGRDRRVYPFLIYGLALWLTHAVTLQTVNFYVMDTLRVDGALATQLAGSVLMAGAFAMMLAQLVLIPRLKWPPRSLMILGAALAILAQILFALAHSFGEILVGMVVVGVAIGLARPGISGGVSLAVTPEEQGRAAGMNMAASGVGFLLAPFTGLMTYQLIGPSTPYWINAGLALFALVFAFWHRGLRNRPQIEETPPEPTET